MRYCDGCSRDTTATLRTFASWFNCATSLWKSGSGGPSMASKATVRAPPSAVVSSAGIPDVVQPLARPPAAATTVRHAILSAAGRHAASLRYVPRNIADPCPCGSPGYGYRNVAELRGPGILTNGGEVQGVGRVAPGARLAVAHRTGAS